MLLYDKQNNMPPKKKTGRKWSVLQDELGVKRDEGGCYAVMAASTLQNVTPAGHKMIKNAGFFKIGFALSFEHRFSFYENSHPAGVYICCLLVDPPVPRVLRSNKNKQAAETPRGQIFRKVEAFLHKRIVELGGVMYRSTARVKNMDESGLGETEWFLCDEKTLHQAFLDAHEEFGGRLQMYDLQQTDERTGRTMSINNAYKQAKKGKNVYISEVAHRF